MVAVANATTNGFPMIQISGSSDRAIVDLQQGDYEELDQMNAAKPYAKAAFRVNKPQDIGIGLARAIHAAVSGRPGGVYLDLTAEVLSATLDGERPRNRWCALSMPRPGKSPPPNRSSAPSTCWRAPSVRSSFSARAPPMRRLTPTFAHSSKRPVSRSCRCPWPKGLLPDNHPQSAAAARSFVLAQADVVMLIGARLNWLLAHGKAPHWSPTAHFVQVDISPTEIDSNRPIAAPVVADIGSAMSAFLAALKPGQVKPRLPWLEAIAERKQHNIERMTTHLNANPNPMDFYSALRAIRDVLADKPEIYVVNEGANTLDFGRDVIDMHEPRKRLDSGTWGVMGIGMGYAIGAAVVSDKPVVAVEGDSAFGFSGMEIETICRYHLPVVVVVFNNGGIYRGDDVNRSGGADPAPTVLMGQAHYEKLIEAFGGTGYYVADPQGSPRRSPTRLRRASQR